MADLTGWHPDPGGARGRFRYWDGTQWSAETTDDPSRPPPGGPPPEPRRRSRGLLVAAVLAGLVVLVLVGLLIRTLLGNLGPITVDPAPPPTVVGNDSSPTPTPSPTPSPTPTPNPTPSSASPSPSPPSSSSLVPCPLGLPGLRAAHPVDGRVHGGNLSFPAEPTFRPAAEEPRMSFAFDVIQQPLPVNASPPWIAQLAVGQLRAESGFVNDSRNTAESLMQCLMTGPMYDPYQPTRADRRSEITMVSGKQGWLIDSDVTVAEPGLPFAGDRVVVVVVPDGTNWGFFFGAAPIGDVGLNQILDRTVASLQAT